MLAYIVEDSLDITEVERFALESNEFEVKSFENSRDFFKAMSDNKPDLILLDMMNLQLLMLICLMFLHLFLMYL